MNKTLLVLQHEFRNTLRRRAFILLTLAFPLLGLLGIGIYQMVSSTDQPPAENPGPYVPNSMLSGKTDQGGKNAYPFF